jgi:hypothetical protein
LYRCRSYTVSSVPSCSCFLLQRDPCRTVNPKCDWISKRGIDPPLYEREREREREEEEEEEEDEEETKARDKTGRASTTTTTPSPAPLTCWPPGRSAGPPSVRQPGAFDLLTPDESCCLWGGGGGGGLLPVVKTFVQDFFKFSFVNKINNLGR